MVSDLPHELLKVSPALAMMKTGNQEQITKWVEDIGGVIALKAELNRRQIYSGGLKAEIRKKLRAAKREELEQDPAFVAAKTKVEEATTALADATAAPESEIANPQSELVALGYDEGAVQLALTVAKGDREIARTYLRGTFPDVEHQV